MTLATSLMRTLYTHFGLEFLYKENTVQAKEFSLNLCTSFGMPATDAYGQAPTALSSALMQYQLFLNLAKVSPFTERKMFLQLKLTAILMPATVIFGRLHLSCTST